MKSNINFNRLRRGGKRRSGPNKFNPDHAQISAAVDKFLKTGGKITSYDIEEHPPTFLGIGEADNFLLGNL